MKDIDLGVILENGSRVVAVMKIDNMSCPEDLMVLKSKGVNGDDIFVTGHHYIKGDYKFVKVYNHPGASKPDTVKASWLSCLVTDDHHIQIGSHVFWDWDDDDCDLI